MDRTVCGTCGDLATRCKCAQGCAYMNLHELAALCGVETRELRGGWPRGDEPLRPDLLIAHEVLAKLPDNYELKWLERDQWYWEEDRGRCKKCGQHINLTEQGTFVEAVVALGNRVQGDGNG